MNRNFVRPILLACFVLIGMFHVNAQDIHWSQYYNAPFSLNPALTGVFDGDTRFHGNLRSQWRSTPVTYRTGNIGFDTKLFSSDLKTSFWGLGGMVNFDHAGDSQMGTLNVSLQGAYTRQLNPRNFLTLGVRLAGYQRSFKTENLRWDNQFVLDGGYDPNAPSRENFADQTILYGSFGVGLNYHYQKADSRTRIDLGGGVFQINRPEVSFFEDSDVRLEQRFNFYGMGVFQVADDFDFVVNLMGNYQSPHVEHVGVIAGRMHLNQKPTKETALQLGIGYRFNDGFGVGDAVIPHLQFHKKAWIFGLSYDLNISGFDVATDGLGGPEASVIYIFRKVPVVEFCPTCPVYL